MNTNTNAASVPGPEDQKFNAWYESKFKPAMERGPLDKYVARQAWFAALSTAAQPPASYEHQHAIMEGERNDSLRIHIEQANGSSTPRSERAYETGFTNGWNRALAAAPKAELQGKADASPLNSADAEVKAEPAGIENASPGLSDLAAHLRGECQDAIDEGDGFINVTRVLEIVNQYHAAEPATKCEWCDRKILDADAGPACQTRSQAHRCDAMLAASAKAEPVQQPERVPLTNAEFVAAIEASGFTTWDSRMWELKRHLEAAHGIQPAHKEQP